MTPHASAHPAATILEGLTALPKHQTRNTKHRSRTPPRPPTNSYGLGSPRMRTNYNPGT
jgi:hypothetical protein